MIVWPTMALLFVVASLGQASSSVRHSQRDFKNVTTKLGAGYELSADVILRFEHTSVKDREELRSQAIPNWVAKIRKKYTTPELAFVKMDRNKNEAVDAAEWM